MMQRPNMSNNTNGTKYSPLSVEPSSELDLESGSNNNDTSRHSPEQQGQSQLSATINLSKCICGAGSFALPHVFLEEGVLGGTLALTLCGGLAAYTMASLARSKWQCQGVSSSYVELAEASLGKRAGQTVFVLTLSASMGVCSTYLVFIGETLESLSCDNTQSNKNLIRTFLPDIPASTWEVGTALLVFPLCLLRSYRVFAFTSALGVGAVMGGILVTLASGIWVEPGFGVALEQIWDMPLWPDSLAKAFGSSFGTIAYLFCINFLTFPILNSMANPKEEYASAVNTAVAGVWLVNVVFAILCLGFYGHNTQDLVLGNLSNGPYLSALKLLLCVDLLFTFPIVFLGGRQILEAALLPPSHNWRTAMVATAVACCWGLTKIGGFGTVANLVGGVAQGTLAFIMPPAIAVALARRNGEQGGEAAHWVVCIFGVVVVSSVTYFTAFP
ncbi:Amino acid transporter [Seminavis robusta]|uniref:Amino acid transporter n=1 Tax=Seminavis robusta TaxID=568900 RepID=A0A9N8HQD1_9STRA|nr:Amino acid transporter [Seminavis robusta]|eukprot:Sro1154_g247090.1 Amino acid transporter (444) ;mRNA; f:4083-5414